MTWVEVMNDQAIDSIHAQPLQGIFISAQDAKAAVIESRYKWKNHLPTALHVQFHASGPA
jgi:hypothetical protein